uniref:Uncharacterized protein n=1 Tax=Arundo donax TaxID=35708 RepID=A0A0A9CUI9_ARUDO
MQSSGHKLFLMALLSCILSNKVPPCLWFSTTLTAKNLTKQILCRICRKTFQRISGENHYHNCDPILLSWPNCILSGQTKFNLIAKSSTSLSSSSFIAGSSPSSKSSSSKGSSISSCTSVLWQGSVEILPLSALHGTPHEAPSLFTGPGLAFAEFLAWSFLLLFFFLFLAAFPPPESPSPFIKQSISSKDLSSFCSSCT